MVGHPFDTVKVRLQTQPMANPVYSECQAAGALCVRCGAPALGLLAAGSETYPPTPGNLPQAAR